MSWASDDSSVIIILGKKTGCSDRDNDRAYPSRYRDIDLSESDYGSLRCHPQGYGNQLASNRDSKGNSRLIARHGSTWSRARSGRTKNWISVCKSWCPINSQHDCDTI